MVNALKINNLKSEFEYSSDKIQPGMHCSVTIVLINDTHKVFDACEVKPKIISKRTKYHLSYVEEYESIRMLEEAKKHALKEILKLKIYASRIQRYSHLLKPIQDIFFFRDIFYDLFKSQRFNIKTLTWTKLGDSDLSRKILDFEGYLSDNNNISQTLKNKFQEHKEDLNDVIDRIQARQTENYNFRNRLEPGQKCSKLILSGIASFQWKAEHFPFEVEVFYQSIQEGVVKEERLSVENKIQIYPSNFCLLLSVILGASSFCILMFLYQNININYQVNLLFFRIVLSIILAIPIIGAPATVMLLAPLAYLHRNINRFFKSIKKISIKDTSHGFLLGMVLALLPSLPFFKDIMKIILSA